MSLIVVTVAATKQLTNAASIIQHLS